MNASDDHHQSVSAWLDTADDDLATTPLIVAEADHLVSARGGRAARSALRADLASAHTSSNGGRGQCDPSSRSPSATPTTNSGLLTHRSSPSRNASRRSRSPRWTSDTSVPCDHSAPTARSGCSRRTPNNPQRRPGVGQRRPARASPLSLPEPATERDGTAATPAYSQSMAVPSLGPFRNLETPATESARRSTPALRNVAVGRSADGVSTGRVGTRTGRPSLFHSRGTRRAYSTGFSGRLTQSRKPVWAISPSGVRIPPSPLDPLIYARLAGE
jgi:hypothetical protein